MSYFNGFNPIFVLNVVKHDSEIQNSRALDVVVSASASGKYARFDIKPIHNCMSCRGVQGLYRRIDIASPPSRKNTTNLYRRAADTEDFDY